MMYMSHISTLIDRNTHLRICSRNFVCYFINFTCLFQEYTVDMYFRTEWYDPRLTYTEIDKGLNLNAEMVEKVWVPDTYFVNEKDARFHDVIAKNSLIRLSPDGRILFSTRFV